VAELLDLAGPAVLAGLVAPAGLVALDGLVVGAAPVALVSLGLQFVLDAPAEQASADLPLQSLKLLSNDSLEIRGGYPKVADSSRRRLIMFEGQNEVKIIF